MICTVLHPNQQQQEGPILLEAKSALVGSYPEHMYCITIIEPLWSNQRLITHMENSEVKTHQDSAFLLTGVKK